MSACHEGAIGMADGKAKLLRDDYCDGLGDCLPTCPTGKLAPVNAPYFDGAKLLIAADCTAFAYANLHQEFMKGKITLIGCPKLDSVDYSEKLTQIIQTNNIQSVTIIRMEVPCCGGLEAAAKTAESLSRGRWLLSPHAPFIEYRLFHVSQFNIQSLKMQ